ncbi:MAG: imidazolonepropionase [Actinobacteria bacterium]|nr:imidazolonepropionase [Actinomycetota bacterium]
MTGILLDRIGRLWTGVERGVVTDAAVAIVDGAIAWIGDAGADPAADSVACDDRVDCGGGLVTPGLIDAHTHPVYGGSRLAEIAARTAGRPYGASDAETGIGATVTATRATDAAQLRTAVRRRLRGWTAGGATTVETKTGYHLTRDGELGAVALLDELRGGDGLPDLHVTFLAAHAVPPDHTGTPDEHIDASISWLGAAAQQGADACDVFCDEGYFTVAQARRVLSAGQRAGLTTHIHADELAHTGGAQLAAEVGAASADHLLHVTDDDARAMADAGVVATLCPGTALAVGELPDVAALQRHGVTIALGSDHNPGMVGTTDMSLVVCLGVAAFGLSVTEALAAATHGGARALRLDDRGGITEGARADLVWWDAEHEGAFAWAWGLPPRAVWRSGDRIV